MVVVFNKKQPMIWITISIGSTVVVYTVHCSTMLCTAIYSSGAWSPECVFVWLSCEVILSEREYDIIPRHPTSCSLLRYFLRNDFPVLLGLVKIILILIICDAGNTFVPIHT